MVYGRVGDQLYLHGAIGNAMLRRLSDGIDVCVTVTIVDAHVLSRSAFHHSMNYRSVVAFGEATLVEDRDEKHRALRAVVDHNLPGRSDECRGPNESELRRDARDPRADHRGVGEGTQRSADRGARGSGAPVLGR